MAKFGLEALKGKALFVWLEFIEETGDSLALIYLAGMFINKIKTKFNRFLQNGFKYKKDSQLLLKKFPHNG